MRTHRLKRAALAALTLFLGCSTNPSTQGPAPEDLAGVDLWGADLSGQPDLRGQVASPDLQRPSLGSSVLVFSGEGGLPGGTGRYLIPSFEELHKTVKPLGFTAVETDAWPASLLAYRAVFWFLPGATKPSDFLLPESRVQQLRDYLRDGGRLVLVGDLKFVYDGYDSGKSHRVMNDLLQRLSVNLRFSMGLPDEKSCGPSSHPLAKDIGSVAYNTSGDIRVAAPGEWLSCKGAAAQDRLCGDVVLATDIEILSTGASTNQKFVRSLLLTPGPAPCAP